MPVKQQAFWSKRKTWLKAIQSTKLPEKFEALFDKDGWAHISREDILKEQNIEKVIYMTVLWGYPSGMRNNYFISIIKKINTLIAIIETAQENGGVASWFDHFEEVSEIRGLGLSTYSKLLYFLNMQVEGLKPLILDLRLIGVFEENIYEEFRNLSFLRYGNAPKNYLLYLEVMQSIASKLKVNIDNLEMFLFSFGENIKEQECESGKGEDFPPPPHTT